MAKAFFFGVSIWHYILSSDKPDVHFDQNLKGKKFEQLVGVGSDDFLVSENYLFSSQLTKLPTQREI